MPISSDKACEHAKTEKPQDDIPVEGTPGLALRVTADGSKTWTLRYYRQSDGKRRRLSLGAYPAVKLKEARERARKAVNGVSDGDDPAGAKQERRAADTVASLAAQWLAAKIRQGRREGYMRDAQRRIGRVPEALAGMKAADVRRIHVTGALETVAPRGDYETNAMHRMLSGIFKWGVSEGHLDIDPTAGVKKRFSEAARTRYFDDAETRAFWFGLDTAKCSEAARIAMRLCLVTGQRPNEIVSLERKHVQLEVLHPIMTIAAGKSKNHDAHSVPLPTMAVDLLRRAIVLAGESPLVFPSPKGIGSIDPHALSKIIERARDKKAGTLFGIADAQLYDCKKTVATWLGNAGYTNEQVGRLLNHRSAKSGSVTGRHYNHAEYMVERRRMLEQWSRHLESVIGIARAEASNVVKLEIA